MLRGGRASGITEPSLSIIVLSTEPRFTPPSSALNDPELELFEFSTVILLWSLNRKVRNK
jgi:hypothetical protein